MTEYWRQYGHSVRLLLLVAVVAYDVLGGVLVLVRWSDYGHPLSQLGLWACCAGLLTFGVVRARGPNFLPVATLTLVLAGYVLSNLDLVSTRTIMGTWAVPMIGITLGVLQHFVPLWCTAAAMTSTAGVLWIIKIVTDGPSTFQAPGSLGPVFGTLPSLVVVLMMRRRAMRTEQAHRQLAVARDAERAVSRDRAAMLMPAMSKALDVLRQLAHGTADPTDPAVRRACAVAERQLRAALVAATTETGLALLAQQLLGGARGDVELVAQGDDSWDRLPAPVRTAVAELLHHTLADCAIRNASVTSLPDGDRIWLSLTCTGGAPPGKLPIELSRPSARGADGDQWWLEWTLHPENSEETDDKPRARRSGLDRRSFDVSRWRRALAGK